ncbi:MAG: hypothetical protein PWQ78_559 [Petrotoga sp.]|nr:hypothetical protein [Petrotoga sp.]
MCGKKHRSGCYCKEAKQRSKNRRFCIQILLKYNQHKHSEVEDIMEILSDCNVWVAKSKGKKSKEVIMKSGYTPLIINSDSIQEAEKKIVKALDHHSFLGL